MDISDLNDELKKALKRVGLFKEDKSPLGDAFINEISTIIFNTVKTMYNEIQTNMNTHTHTAPSGTTGVPLVPLKDIKLL